MARIKYLPVKSPVRLGRQSFGRQAIEAPQLLARGAVTQLRQEKHLDNGPQLLCASELPRPDGRSFVRTNTLAGGFFSPGDSPAHYPLSPQGLRDYLSFSSTSCRVSGRLPSVIPVLDNVSYFSPGLPFFVAIREKFLLLEDEPGSRPLAAWVIDRVRETIDRENI